MRPPVGRAPRLAVLVLAAAGALAHAQQAQRVGPAFTLEQVKSYPYPTGLTASASGARIAWAFNERGLRNIWVAEAPSWTARRLTSYLEDDGQELTSIAISPDGAHVVYVRGGDHSSNWDDELPVNPVGAPTPIAVQVWTVPFAGGEPVSLGEGGNPVVSPRSDRVAFERDRQIWMAPVDGSAPARKLFTARGTNADPRWSPDGARLAFVSSRGTHSLVGVFTDERTPIAWMAPTTSRDGSPRWSRDGTRIAFVRRPGTGGAPQPVLERHHQPWGIWVAEVATGEAKRLWQAPETLRGSIPTTHGATNLHWADGRIVFLSYEDGWPHLYAIDETGGTPRQLTRGGFMNEHASLSPDGRALFSAANTGDDPNDIDRRHVLRVAVDGSGAQVVTPGTGLEWSPVVTGDGQWLAYVAATAQRPPLPHVRPVAGGEARAIGADRVPPDFPSAQLVTPTPVTYRAPDGVVVHAQLFAREGGPSRKPAIVYVHGGPPRQMLLGWHYSDYYANAYAMNQHLASRGFVVLSINYRLGIGYGYEFHQPAGAGSAGAAEYQDVKAAGEYLRTLPQVDPARIGIYGGSYGGYLTALALARDSSLFAAGVDIHGVHNFASPEAGARASLLELLNAPSTRLEPNDRERALKVAWESSPASSVATWRSPVLLIHADDDRNVRFAQTVDLVRRLSQRKVPYEEIVIPDDTHHWMRHANQLRVSAATAGFFERQFLK